MSNLTALTTDLKEPPSGGSSAFLKKMRRVLKEETAGFHLRLLLAQALLAPVPYLAGARLRAAVYRSIGFEIGRGTVILGDLTINSRPSPYRRLTIGHDCVINSPVYLNLTAPITIGNDVGIGHHVVIITTNHIIGPPHRRLGPERPMAVEIKDGAWICSGATILPGVTIGEGSIVAAGAVVSRDVPAHTLAGGVPAETIHSRLPDGHRRSQVTGTVGPRDPLERRELDVLVYCNCQRSVRSQ